MTSSSNRSRNYFSWLRPTSATATSPSSSASQPVSHECRHNAGIEDNFVAIQEPGLGHNDRQMYRRGGGWFHRAATIVIGGRHRHRLQHHQQQQQQQVLQQQRSATARSTTWTTFESSGIHRVHQCPATAVPDENVGTSQPLEAAIALTEDERQSDQRQNLTWKPGTNAIKHFLT